VEVYLSWAPVGGNALEIKGTRTHLDAGPDVAKDPVPIHLSDADFARALEQLRN